MIHHLIQFFAFVAAVLITAKMVPGIRVKSIGGGIVFSLVFALLNKLLFVPLVMVTFPIVVVSLGLFLVIINAFIFWLTDKIVKGVEVDGFGAAVLGSVVVTLVNWGITWALRVIA
jgi:putative membrane protein